MVVLIFKLVPEHQNHLLLQVFRICIFKEYGLSPSIEIHCHLQQGILSLSIFYLILFISTSLIFLNCFSSFCSYQCFNYFINYYHSNSFCFNLNLNWFYFDLMNRIFLSYIAFIHNIDCSITFLLPLHSTVDLNFWIDFKRFD